jgi:hypothetical protein
LIERPTFSTQRLGAVGPVMAAMLMAVASDCA